MLCTLVHINAIDNIFGLLKNLNDLNKNIRGSLWSHMNKKWCFYGIVLLLYSFCVGSVKRFSRDVEAIRTLDVNEDTDG